MVSTCIYIITFVFLFLGFYFLFKQNENKNLVLLAPIIILVIFNIQAIGAMIVQTLGMDVDLDSAAIIFLIINFIVWFLVIRQKLIKKIVIGWKDALIIAIPVALIVFEMLHMFSAELRLSYPNDDPASFFDMAYIGFNTQSVTGMYYTQLINATFIALFSPFLKEAYYYQAFIIADLIMHILEIMMFYTLCRKISDKKIVQYSFPVIGILYYAGYPTFSFMRGNFVYWSTGVTILMFLIYALIGLERERKKFKYYLILLALGLYANTVCNKLYVVVNTVAVLFALLIILFERFHLNIQKKIGIVIGICIIGFITFSIYFWKFWGASVDTIVNYIKIDGNTYMAPFQDFVLFIPIILIVLWYAYIKKMVDSVICNITMCMFIMWIGMYIVWHCGLMSEYFYYKIYYNLWLLAWLFVILLLHIFLTQKRLAVLGVYIGFVLVLFVLQFGIAESREENNYFNLYAYNIEFWEKDYTDKEMESSGRYINEEELNSFQYVIDNLGGSNVLFVAAFNNYMEGRWFHVITVKDNKVLYGDYVERVEEFLDDEYDYLAVSKKSDIYKEAYNILMNQPCIYENQELIIVQCN